MGLFARVSFCLVLGSVSSFCLSAHATPIITAVGSSIIANGATAPGAATDYDFFGTTAQPVLTNFTVSTGSSNIFNGGSCCGYTQITVPGGSRTVTTGLDYPNGNSNGVPVLFATFSADASGSFTVYVLDANSDANDLLNTYISLGVNGGTPISIAVCGLEGTCSTQRVNEFTEFTVTGASPTDVFDIYATSNDQRPSIGGVTFDQSISATPEPSSIALSLTGCLQWRSSSAAASRFSVVSSPCGLSANRGVRFAL